MGKADWRKIGEYLNNRKIEKLTKYKLDMNQDIREKVTKIFDKNRKKVLIPQVIRL